MSENKRGRGFGGRGYYIALVLCAAAIGIMSYVVNADRQDPAVQAANVPAAVTGSLPTQPAKPGQTEPSTAPTAGKLSVCAPVQGEVVMGYAMEVLGYNETTRDWRVHNGVDFAAAAGTPVSAAADGQVYTVYEDDRMGTTVVIRHEGGYTTKYSSLSPDVVVSAGQEVAMGQTIGSVGTTALLENALGDHVHFCVTKNDEVIDPMEFLN